MSDRPPDRGTRWPLRRFVVADRSMLPTLQPGQGLIARRATHAKVGELRCLEHPDRPNFWLVKRVTSLPTSDTIEVQSDNLEEATVDSRSFGPVPLDNTWKVVIRIPPRLM